MSDTVELHTFPRTDVEALALLYVEKKLTSECTPEDVAKLYAEALSTIKTSLKAANKERRSSASFTFLK